MTYYLVSRKYGYQELPVLSWLPATSDIEELFKKIIAKRNDGQHYSLVDANDKTLYRANSVPFPQALG